MRPYIANLFSITEINVQKCNVLNYFQENNAKIDSNDVLSYKIYTYIYSKGFNYYRYNFCLLLSKFILTKTSRPAGHFIPACQ